MNKCFIRTTVNKKKDYFADALQDVDNVFEIANVVDWESELKITEMSWTVNELFFAGSANSILISHSL